MLDMCALIETKLMGSGEVMLGKMVGTVSEIEEERKWRCY